MSGHFQKQRRFKTLKGLFTTPIPYEARLAEGDKWSNYFGNYVGQRYGRWDTSCCWAYAAVGKAETQLEWLWKNNKFSDDTKRWFKDNGYIDEDGDFYLSRRWAAILAGSFNNGNDNQEFWRLASTAGLIPYTMLPFEVKDGVFYYNQAEFNKDFFNKDLITKEMEELGKEFLKRVHIDYQELGKRWTVRQPSLLQSALRQSPLQIGVPVPLYGWNQEKVDWDGQKQPAHSIELYEYDETSDYPYMIYDSYEPHLKRLSRDYVIPLITQAVLTPTGYAPKKEAEKTFLDKLWEAVRAFWYGEKIPAGYPIGVV